MSSALARSPHREEALTRMTWHDAAMHDTGRDVLTMREVVGGFVRGAVLGVLGASILRGLGSPARSPGGVPGRGHSARRS